MKVETNKECKACGNTIADTATGRRKSTKYCSLHCYRSAARQFHKNEVEKDKHVPSWFAITALGGYVIMFIIIGYLLIRMNNEEQIITAYNYNFLITETEQKEEECT